MRNTCVFSVQCAAHIEHTGDAPRASFQTVLRTALLDCTVLYCVRLCSARQLIATACAYNIRSSTIRAQFQSQLLCSTVVMTTNLAERLAVTCFTPALPILERLLLTQPLMLLLCNKNLLNLDLNPFQLIPIKMRRFDR